MLSNDGIPLDEVFRSWVPHALGDMKDVVLIVDWTDFDDDHTTLYVMAATGRGRALPLAWRTIHKSESIGNRAAESFRRFFRFIACLMPLASTMSSQLRAITSAPNVVTKSGDDLAKVITRMQERRERCRSCRKARPLWCYGGVSQRVEELLKDRATGITTRARGHDEGADDEDQADDDNSTTPEGTRRRLIAEGIRGARRP